MTNAPTDISALLTMARDALPLWGIPAEATVSVLNISENVTCLVEREDGRSVLRIHRTGYHSERGVASELAWMHALGEDAKISTPSVILGRNGEAIQHGIKPGSDERRMMVMFAHLKGHEAQLGTADAEHFARIGAFSARAHHHATGWKRPDWFERFSWDVSAVFGPNAIWGDWRDAPHVGKRERDILEAVEKTIISRLKTYGTSADRYGLIHADMRLANLLIDGETTHLIDFDDCGFGWHLYDFAAAVSFIEDHPSLEEIKAAWLEGYRKIRVLAADDEDMIDTFVMFRRLALLAWIGSHIDAPEPQALAPDFARISAELGDRFLSAQA